MYQKQHPGHVLMGEVLERDWNLTETARQLGLERGPVRDLLLGHVDVTPDLAEAMCRATGVSAQTWLNLQAAFDGSEEEIANAARAQVELDAIRAIVAPQPETQAVA